MIRLSHLAAGVSLLLALLPRSASGLGVDSPWQRLEPRLELGVFAGPPATVGDGQIWILRVDPARFELRLLGAWQTDDGKLRTAREWCSRSGAVAAINASMFKTDYRTSVSYMKTRSSINNPRFTKDKGVLAFDPLSGTVPPVQIIDRACQNLQAVAPRYGTLIQSIRMISCERTNTWAPSSRRWSTAGIGLDGKGRILFIHARSPWSVHDLVDGLLALPIDLRRAIYAEGGPEAQLYFKAGGREQERVGSFETGFHEDDLNTWAWGVPNVVAIVPRRDR